jgi:hypothetical protein
MLQGHLPSGVANHLLQFPTFSWRIPAIRGEKTGIFTFAPGSLEGTGRFTDGISVRCLGGSPSNLDWSGLGWLLDGSAGGELVKGGVLLAFVCAGLLASGAVPADAARVHHCGNPPGWSGKLSGIGVGCHKARGVFNGIHCVDRGCDEIASGRWECFRHAVSRYVGRGNCHLQHKRIRWVVFE